MSLRSFVDKLTVGSAAFQLGTKTSCAQTSHSTPCRQTKNQPADAKNRNCRKYSVGPAASDEREAHSERHQPVSAKILSVVSIFFFHFGFPASAVFFFLIILLKTFSGMQSDELSFTLYLHDSVFTFQCRRFTQTHSF